MRLLSRPLPIFLRFQPAMGLHLLALWTLAHRRPLRSKVTSGERLPWRSTLCKANAQLTCPTCFFFYHVCTPNCALFTGYLCPTMRGKSPTVFSLLAGFPAPERCPATLGHVHVCRTRSHPPRPWELFISVRRGSAMGRLLSGCEDSAPGKALSPGRVHHPTRRQGPVGRVLPEPRPLRQAQLCPESQPCPPGAGGRAHPPQGRK